MTESIRQDKQKSDDPVVDLFPEDENEDRSSKYQADENSRNYNTLSLMCINIYINKRKS